MKTDGWARSENVLIKPFLETNEILQSDFAQAVLNGLSKQAKSISSKFLYDARGSELYQQITELPEYYLMNAEREILQNSAAAVAARFAGSQVSVVEPAAGCSDKSWLVLRALSTVVGRVVYRPFDISSYALEENVQRFSRTHRNVEIQPIVGDFLTDLSPLTLSGSEAPTLVLFLGSTIGNLVQEEQMSLLRRLRQALRAGDMALIGFDLQKASSIVVPAYDDAAGVTARFNFNLLERMNRELGADSILEHFEHVARYNVRLQAMESFLKSTRAQTITFAELGWSVEFKEKELLHTEYSHKFSVPQIRNMAREAAFEEVDVMLDSKGYFADVLWKVI